MFRPRGDAHNKRPWGFLDGFRCAFVGMAYWLRTQPHSWFDAVATVAVVGSGAWLKLTHMEWCALVLAIGLVWTAEGLNTALEVLADEVCPEHNERIGRVKDVSAAAVLTAALTAAIIALVVFVPRLAPFVVRTT
jgi:diacylglycerol kinase (ATP)